jgi:prepilin-type N-terminal cleavage/methylation domain-containing protein
MISPRPIHGKRACGFTILELLVAVSVLTVVVGIVYESFASVLDSTEMARAQAEQLRFRQFLWRHLNQNVASAYSDAACMSPEYQFLGTDQEGPTGPADSLRFCTSLPMDGPNALPGVLKVVSYEVTGGSDAEGGGSMLGAASIDQGAEDATQGTVLIIREEPLLLESGEMDSVPAEMDYPVNELKIPIASMDLQYYDGNADEWLPEWDSITEGRMPWAVQIKINFQRTEEEAEADAQSGINSAEEPDLNLTIPFPAGGGVVDQFMDVNHRRNTVMTDTASDNDLFGKGVDTKTKNSDKKNKKSTKKPSRTSGQSSMGGDDF